MRGKILFLVLFAVLASLAVVAPAPAAHLVGGPIVLMGIDAEDGGVGGHGPITIYESVVADLMASASKGSGVLVIGGGKSSTDSVTQFWNKIGTDLGISITYANGSAAGTVSLTAFRLVAIVSDLNNTPGGGLTLAENDLIGNRDTDFAAHINSGGGLLGFSQTGLPQPWYAYLDALGTFTVAGGGGSNITPTAEGSAIGITDALDVCCWHDDYITFPSFLVPLAHYAGTTRIAAIGGARVVVLRDCTASELTVSITRPVAGRLYEDNGDIGPSGASRAFARGASLTITASTSAAAEEVVFLLDGVVAGVDLSTPFSATATLPPVIGPHTIEVRAISAVTDCIAKTSQIFDIVCFDAVPTIIRPEAGRLYDNDVDIGVSGSPDAAVVGGALTITATSSKPARTQRIDFLADAIPVGSVTTTPYNATLNAGALSPGVHVLTATLFEHSAGCTRSVTVLLRKADPAVLAVALGVSVTNAVPTEVMVTAGGARVSGKGGSAQVRIVDESVSVVDFLHVVTDRVDASVAGTTLESTAVSLLENVSLLSGQITVDVLESRVKVTYDLSTRQLTMSDAGSRILGLNILGTPVDVTEPNTTMTVPGVGSITLQETLSNNDGVRGEMTVNALHVFLDPGYPAQEIILSSAHAGTNGIVDSFVGPDSDLIHRPDDLHTGADAGGEIAAAMPITPGVSSAALSSGDQTDFYRFEAGQGDRILASIKPAERTVVNVITPPALPGVSHARPSALLYLRDPSGAIRARSELSLGGAEPQKVELNADVPFTPLNAKATWTLEVRRLAGSPDGFYTIEFALLPVMLAAQEDGGQAGDASDSCLAPRPLTGGPLPAEIDNITFTGVIRDADQADFYSLHATSGRLLTIAMKPDELDDGADFDLFLYRPSTSGGLDSCTFLEASSTLSHPQAKALPEVIAVAPVMRTGLYILEIRRINAVANYTVEINATNPMPTIPGNDAGTGADAGNACVSPTPVTVGAYQGQFVQFPGDDEDWYSVLVPAGEDLTAVMKPNDLSNFDLAVFDASCSAVPHMGVTGLTLSAPETVVLQNAPGGVYRLRVSRVAGAGNYALTILLSP